MLRQYLDVELHEKEVIDIDIIDRDLINVDINILDMLKDRGWVAQTIRSTIIRNEVPTKLNAREFTTAYQFISNSLEVYYNGIKEKAITAIGNQKFTFAYDTISGDTIEISYIRTV